MKLLRAVCASTLVAVLALVWTACSSSSSGGAAAPDASTDAPSQDASADQHVGADAGSGADADAASSLPDAATDVGAEGEEGPPPCMVDGGTTYLGDAVEISIGSDIACAIRQGGKVVCWGQEAAAAFHELAFPAEAGAVVAKDLVVSARTVCVLDSESAVWCAGSNYRGQLGNGTPADSAEHTTPTQVVDAQGHAISAVKLGGGFDFTCALTAQGTVLCWGTDTTGQLGQDSGTLDEAGSAYSSVALPVPGISFPGGALGPNGFGEFECASGAGGVACWGGNDVGQCVEDVTPSASNFDVAAPLSEAGAALPVQWVSVGEDHACALDATGQVYCWGTNDEYERGTTAATGIVPNQVPGLADAGVTGLACGRSWTCVVDSARHARCFGIPGGYGYLGNGMKTGPATADPVTVVDVDGGGALSGVARIYAGGATSCALLVGSCGASGPGSVVCWGYGPDVGGSALSSNGIPEPVLLP